MRTFTTGLAVLALLLCMAPSSPASIYFRFLVPLQTETGEAVTGATYFVYTAGTTDTAAIYSDRAGTRNYQGEGETTGSDGSIDFYALAGCYDIAYTHSDRNLDDSLDNFCAGLADSLSQAIADSIYVRVVVVTEEADIAVVDSDTTLVANSLILDSTAGGYLQFGRDGNTTAFGRMVLPDNHSLWLTRWGDDSEAQRLDSSTRYSLGFGGGGYQMQEESTITYALGSAVQYASDANDDGDWADSAYDGPYDDELVIYYESTDGDTVLGKTRQELIIANTRTNRNDWMWGGAATADSTYVIGSYAGNYGPPEHGIQFQTNLPDSASGGNRTAFSFRWVMTPSDTLLQNEDSKFVEILEQNSVHYAFLRDGLRIYSPSSAGASIHEDDEKYIIIESSAKDTTAAAYTILQNDRAKAFSMRCNNKTLRVRDYDNSDDATLDVFKADVDTLNFGINTATYKGNLPTASGHTSQVWFNAALDTCWISTGSAWLQLSQ